jgi:hypothetical protein
LSEVDLRLSCFFFFFFSKSGRSLWRENPIPSSREFEDPLAKVPKSGTNSADTQIQRAILQLQQQQLPPFLVRSLSSLPISSPSHSHPTPLPHPPTQSSQMFLLLMFFVLTILPCNSATFGCSSFSSPLCSESFHTTLFLQLCKLGLLLGIQNLFLPSFLPSVFMIVYVSVPSSPLHAD